MPWRESAFATRRPSSRPRRPRPTVTPGPIGTATPSVTPGSASAGPLNSTTIARIGEPSVQAACSTSGGQTTASPAATRPRSSPTPTQPPPSITRK